MHNEAIGKVNSNEGGNIMMIIGLLAIGFLVYYLMDGKNKTGFAGIGRNNADEILRLRFVNGEIDEKTYLQMKEALK